MSENELIAQLEHVAALNSCVIHDEVHDLLRIKKWAIASLQLGFVEGDRVEIISPKPSIAASEKNSGWYPDREALQVGQTGIAQEIQFNQFSNAWHCYVAMDKAWTVHDEGAGKPVTRYWNGPQEDCPPGFMFHRQKASLFSMNVHWLRKAKTQ